LGGAQIDRAHKPAAMLNGAHDQKAAIAAHDQKAAIAAHDKRPPS
jgi:hypothetical protein